MISSLSDTIIPWLLGGLVILALLTFYITVRSWREAKRSPYFFLRVQAARKMQRYLLASLLLALTMVLVVAFSWQAPNSSAHQLARIIHAKPASQSVTEDVGFEVVASSSPVAVEINMGATGDRTIEAAAELTDPLLKPGLPAEYNQVEASVELNEQTDIGAISFSTDIDDRYQAINPLERVGEGFFTLYATFEYLGLADDMSWSWVWRHNGVVVDGGNQLWSYGDSGPGYVYFQPEDGFHPGKYSLEVWVNDSLMAQSSILVSESVSANN